MKTIPKPKHCGQHWLNMTPTIGGRICGQCSKVIIDFSKMTWTDIERMQYHNNNSICGMYSQKQLDNWGKEIPANKYNLIKVVALSSLTLTLSTEGNSQSSATSDSIVITGKVIDYSTNEPLPFATVQFKNINCGAMTNIDGDFRLLIKDVPSTPIADTLVATFVGYLSTEVVFKDINSIQIDSSGMKSQDINIKMLPNLDQSIAFYVTEPTIGQKIGWKFRKWFGRKEN